MASRHKVLVIDDDRATLYLYQRCLEPDYLVTTTTEWLAAIDLYYAESFDLLILDLKMPVFDPVEFITRIRSDVRQVPILVTSAYPDLLERVKGLSINAGLSKPVSDADLRHAVGQLVQ